MPASAPETISVAIHGAAGRMGQRLVALTLEDPALGLAAALEGAGHPEVGHDAGEVAGCGPAGLTITDAFPDVSADVLIDFSTPGALREALRVCRAATMAIVVGTTGLEEADQRALDEAATEVPVLQAPNMSPGVNLLFAVAAQVARRLGDDYDIEIVEAHHRYKVDAPSGTALGIASAICQATGKSLERDVTHGRHGEAPRQPGQIGMHALRLGDVVGRHSVSFATLGEELQITHIASDRDVFARGALRAAKWVTGRPAGRYSMADVLGLDPGDRN